MFEIGHSLLQTIHDKNKGTVHQSLIRIEDIHINEVGFTVNGEDFELVNDDLVRVVDNVETKLEIHQFQWVKPFNTVKLIKADGSEVIELILSVKHHKYAITINDVAYKMVGDRLISPELDEITLLNT